MQVKWLKGAKTPEAKKQRKQMIIANRDILDLLKDILTDDLNNLEDNELKADVYNVSNWAYQQADSNGAKRALKKVIDLITIEESK